MAKDQQKNSNNIKPKNKSGGKANKSKRFRRVLLTIIGAVALVAATVITVLWFMGGDDAVVVADRPVLQTGARGSLITLDNIDVARAEIEAPIEDPNYTYTMSIEWTFESWDRPSRDAYVENATMNTRTVFFDLFLDSTGERIYSSPYIPLGAALDSFALDTEVPAGRHTATVVYYLVDDDYEVLTDVSVMVWLNILG